MQRPISQHLFALAAEAERMKLTLKGLREEGIQQGNLQDYGQTEGFILQAISDLGDVVRDLLHAGNRLKDSGK